jgi:DNA repair protein RadC
METKKNITLKDWSEMDKPRERLLSQGAKQLTDAELLAILMRTGVPGKNVVEAAKELLASADNSLVTLSLFDYSRLRTFKGMAKAKAATLMAALEIGWRLHGETNTRRETLIANSDDLFKHIHPLIVNIDHEEFWAVYMNNRNKVLGTQRISVGGQTETNVDPRILFRGALEAKATTVAVAHNHPSGTLKPSSNDRALTKRLAEAGNMLGIKLAEHIIVAVGPDGRADYYSFHDNGML